MRVIRLSLVVFLALGAWGCEQDDAGGEEGAGGQGGGGQTDGGVGGMGGDPGMGGAPGGACASLSEAACGRRDDCAFGDGGCQDAAEAPCAALGEAQCGDRDDCLARDDINGDFARCDALATADCRLLDAVACDTRDDCAWDGEQCAAHDEGCPGIGDQGACEGAECHWYDGACHVDPPTMRCDQPDPASCEAAGCAWTDDGCGPMRAACAELAQPLCQARPDCDWMGNRCRASGPVDCETLDADACAAQAGCEWNGDACLNQVEGACDTLDEAACLGRRDCRPLYDDGADGERPAPPPGDEAPPIEDPPVGNFVGCEPWRVECATVPTDACDRTPGCHVEWVATPCACEPGSPDCDAVCEPVPVCVDDGPDACADLPLEACAADPRCRLTDREVCDGGGMGAPEPPPDEDPGLIAPPCRVETVCEPDPNAGGDCAAIEDPDRCEATPGCFGVWLEDECGFGADPIPCDCADGDADCACGAAPAPCLGVFVCEGEVRPGCDGLDPERCEANPACDLVFPPCMCEDPDDPACGCEAVCVDRILPPPAQCEDLDVDACRQAQGCELIEIPCCEPGQDCACAGELVCVPAAGGDRCADRPVDRCEDAPGCHVEEFEVCGCAGGGGEPDVPGGGAPPPPDEPCFCDLIAACVPDERPMDPCAGLPEAACVDRPGCAWELAGEPPPDGCGCFVDEAGVELCVDCVEPVGGWCVPRDEPQGCAALDEAACAEDAACAYVEVGGMCQGCPDGAPDCLGACEPLFGCRPVAELCGTLDGDACAAEPRCAIQPIEMCDGGGPICVDRDGDGNCEMAPPPPDGQCEVVDLCVAAAQACPALDAERCAEVEGCIALVAADGVDLGCASDDPDACWALDPDRCAAHPDCQANGDGGGGGGDCGCVETPDGQVICECMDPLPPCSPR